MPTLQLSKKFHALCHEHDTEMRLTELHMTTESPPTQTSAYACPQPDCAVHYTPSKGYFIAAKHGQVDRDMTPRVTYTFDGQRMYLAEVKSLPPMAVPPARFDSHQRSRPHRRNLGSTQARTK